MKVTTVAAYIATALVILALFAFQQNPQPVRQRAAKIRNGLRKHTGKHRLAIVIPFVGKEIPPYLPLFCMAAGGSADLVDFFIIHDGSLRQVSTRQFPENVQLIDLETKEAFAEHFVQVVDHRVKGDEVRKGLVKVMKKLLEEFPYILVEFKPAYGYIFDKYLKGYSHWAYADLDMVFGDLPRWITKDELNDFDIVTYGYGDQDRLYLRGQFTIHRNVGKINTLWRGCTYLSELDRRFESILSGSAQFHRESAEGCYSTVVLETKDINVKYAAKAFTDVDSRDSVQKHGLYFGIGKRKDKSVIYKTRNDPSGNGKGLLEASTTWFETPHTFYSDPSKLPLERTVGERELIHVNEDTEIKCDLYWIRPKYEPKLCLPKGSVDAHHTVLYLQGQFYRQAVETVPLPHEVISSPFFHFQEWKRRYRAGPLMDAVDRSGSTIAWILTKEGAIPLPEHLSDNPSKPKSRDWIVPSPLGIKPQRWNHGGHQRQLLPDTRYCLVSDQRRFPPEPPASACYASVSWQDVNAVQILTEARGWRSISDDSVALVLTLQISSFQARNTEMVQGLLDLAIVNVHAWQEQPCVLLIHVAGATQEAVATIKDEVSYLGGDSCLVAMMAQETDQDVSRKALQNMASDVAPTRWVLSGLEIERGLVLSTETALFARRHAHVHGSMASGNVMIIPQFGVQDDHAPLESGFLSIMDLMDMRDKGYPLVVSDLTEVEPNNDCWANDGSSLRVMQPLHRLWWQLTTEALNRKNDATSGDRMEAKEIAKILTSADSTFLNLLTEEKQEALERFASSPIVLWDNTVPSPHGSALISTKNLATHQVVRETEELGGILCYNALRLVQLLALGYKLNIVSGAFAVSTSITRKILLQSLPDESTESHCSCHLDGEKHSRDIIRGILGQERRRSAKTAVVWSDMTHAAAQAFA